MFMPVWTQVGQAGARSLRDAIVPHATRMQVARAIAVRNVRTIASHAAEGTGLNF
jgi:hypothetical protein